MVCCFWRALSVPLCPGQGTGERYSGGEPAANFHTGQHADCDEYTCAKQYAHTHAYIFANQYADTDLYPDRYAYTDQFAYTDEYAYTHGNANSGARLDLCRWL